MSKVKYKPINVNQLNWEVMEKKFQNIEVTFAIDVAKTGFPSFPSYQRGNAVRNVPALRIKELQIKDNHLYYHLKSKEKMMEYNWYKVVYGFPCARNAIVLYTLLPRSAWEPGNYKIQLIKPGFLAMSGSFN